MQLETIYRNIRAQAAKAVIVPSIMRGIPRQELCLSVPRLRALLAGRDLEVTLERTLVSLQANDDAAVWFNQLNVAGGVGGGNGFNRVAVDLGRFSLVGQLARLSLKELKAWTSNDSPRAAAEELFSYLSWFTVLRQNGISPYDQWPAIDSIHLHLIGPEEFFIRHGGIAFASGVLGQVEAELAILRVASPELQSVSFSPAPIVLARRIRGDGFIRCFDLNAVQVLIDRGLAAASPLNVLLPEKLPELQNWCRDSLVQAGLN